MNASKSPPLTQHSVRLPLAYRFLPRSVYYGWYITVACALLMFVGVGVGYYGLAVYVRPLQEEHGWSNAAVSGATGLYFSLSGLAAAFVGPYIDRSGPVKLMTVGIILNGLAAASIGFVDTLWQLYLAYSVLAIAFGMSGGVAVNAIMTRWYIRRRARALSFSSTGVSAGGIILSPLIARLIDVGGIGLAAPVMGILVVTVALPVILLVIAWDPHEMGLLPDGLKQPADGEGPAQQVPSAQFRTWTRSEAARRLSFWAVLLAFLLVLMAQTGFVIHQMSFLENRMGSRSEAALALSLTAVGSTVARLVVGTFADALDKRLLTFTLFVLQGSAVLLVVYVESLATTWLGVLIFGFTLGNIYMMQSLLVGEIFGMVSFGTIFGLVSLAGQAGSGVGPFVVGVMEDASGSYTLPLTLTAAVTYLAAVVALFARPVAPLPPPAPGDAEPEMAAIAAPR